MERELLALILELDVGERYVADHGVDAALGQACVAEILNADVLAGMNCLCNSSRYGIHFNTDKACPRLPVTHEVASTGSWLQNGGVRGHAQAGDGLVNRGDDSGGR